MKQHKNAGSLTAAAGSEIYACPISYNKDFLAY